MRTIAAGALAALAVHGAAARGREAVGAPPRSKASVVVLAERPDDVAGLARTKPIDPTAPMLVAGGSVLLQSGPGGTLLVDADGDGKPETKAVPGKPTKVTIRRAEGAPASLSIAFEQAGGAWSYRVASALKVQAGSHEITLVDCDGDGSATGAGDGVLVADSALLVPIRLPLVAANVRWTLNGCDLATPDATPAVEALSSDPLVDATLERVNRFRRTTGLPEVVVDPKINAPCAKHHAYVGKNGFDPFGDAHSESPSKPGYSAEGHAAAYLSLLMALDGPAAMDAWVRTHFHLAPFLVPGLERIGVATGDSFTVLDARSGVGAAPFWKTPYVRSPAPHEKDVHPAFWVAGEVPCPVPLCGKRGHAVSVLAVPETGGTPRPEAVTLKHGKDDVSVLPPIVDPTGSFPRLGGAVPEVPLSPGTYEATFVPGPGATPLRWSFTVPFEK